jgi:multidrug resistance efflux pump
MPGEPLSFVGRVPGWIIRWGISMVMLVFFIFIFLAWLFKYPDIVKTRIVITTQNPPAPLVARTSGKLAYLGVQNNSWVKPGTILAVLDNPADYREVLLLEKDLAKLLTGTLPELSTGWIPDKYQDLGEIQGEYANFIKTQREYISNQSLNYHKKKIQLLNEEVNKYQGYIRGIDRKCSLLERELKLSQKQFERDSAMYTGQVIPQAEFEKSEQQYLQKKYALEEAKIDLSKTQIQVSQTRQAILELGLQGQVAEKALANQLLESAGKLNGVISVWLQKYLLKATVAGKVTFNQVWSENQYVQEGDKVFTIVPQGEFSIVGKLSLPLRNSGKVKSGQKVNIKFDNFPYLEFGMVTGTVNSISLVPTDNFYMVEVNMPLKLVTNYGKTLPFQQEMQGDAEIVTEDMRLLQRIINPIRNVLRNKLAD